MLARFPLVVTALSGMLFAPLRARCDDTAEADFRIARPKFQSRLRAKEPEERIAAVQDLRRYPTVDAVKMVVNSGLKDRVPEVRKAAHETLLALKSNDDICRYLLSTLTKDTRRGGYSEMTPPLITVLLASTSPDIEREVTTYLEKLGATTEGLVLLETLADELGERGNEDDLASLGKLAHLPIFAREFGLRRAVSEAAVKFNRREAIGLLIEILAGVKGTVRTVVVDHLTEVTGMPFGPDADGWAKWWDQNKEKFEYPSSKERTAANKPAVGQGGSMYYGLRIYADRIVFIIDTSGSMVGERLQAAKRELMKAIDGLDENTQFAIVVFNSGVQVWHRDLVPATDRAKQAAARFVLGQEAQGSTASYDALESALRYDAEAIYFLTDGAPNGGKIDAPPAIVEAITRTNRGRRLSIYSIGIGVGQRGGLFDTFLEALAKANWGEYRRVD
ncbi:MAG: VWA domain-containing protein [Planctomycetia bacterium]|nr:VWA domain-containing protein [Planctomycetia bacterium]